MMKRRMVSGLLTATLVFNLGGCSSSNDVPPTTVAELELGKQVVGTLRTWTTQLNDLNKSGMDFNQELLIADSAGQAAATTSASLAYALTAMADAYVSQNKVNIGAANFTVELGSYLPKGFIGTASGVINGLGNRVSITSGMINGDTVNAAVVFSAESGTEFTLDISSAEVSNLHAYTRVDKGNVAVTVTSAATTGTQPKSLAFELQATVGEKDTGLNNQFTGHLIFNANHYANNVTGDQGINVGRFLMGGEFKNIRHSFSATFDVGMRNAGTFVGAIPLQIGYQHKALATYSISADGHSATIEADGDKVMYTHDATTNEVRVTLTYGTYTYTWERSGTYASLENFLTTASLYEIARTYVNGEGAYTLNMPATWDKAGGSLDGTLFYPAYGADNVKMWREIYGMLRLTSTLNGLPEADIVLAVQRTTYNGLSASLIVAYDNVEIKLEGSGTITNLDYLSYYYNFGHGYVPEPGVELAHTKLILTVKTVDATAVVVIEPDAYNNLLGVVTVNGVVVGNIKLDPKTRTLLVTYVDGTFETVIF